MPIYDYVCGACGHRFEVFHGLSEAGPHQCPSCGGQVTRAFAPPTIVFRGSGWAKVDRRATAPARRASRAAGEGDPGTGPASTGEAAAASSTGADERGPT